MYLQAIALDVREDKEGNFEIPDLTKISVNNLHLFRIKDLFKAQGWTYLHRGLQLHAMNQAKTTQNAALYH